MWGKSSSAEKGRREGGEEYQHGSAASRLWPMWWWQAFITVENRFSKMNLKFTISNNCQHLTPSRNRLEILIDKQSPSPSPKSKPQIPKYLLCMYFVSGDPPSIQRTAVDGQIFIIIHYNLFIYGEFWIRWSRGIWPCADPDLLEERNGILEKCNIFYNWGKGGLTKFYIFYHWIMTLMVITPAPPSPSPNASSFFKYLLNAFLCPTLKSNIKFTLL